MLHSIALRFEDDVTYFITSSALVAEVFASAMADGATQFAKDPQKVSADQSASAFWRYASNYLSEAHRDNIDHGCPVAGFAGDTPRLDFRAQSHFAGGLDAQIMMLAELIAESGSILLTGERRPLREWAISLHCKMVEALVLSRSVAEVAPTLANEILDNVRRDVLACLDEHSSTPKPRKRH